MSRLFAKFVIFHLTLFSFNLAAKPNCHDHAIKMLKTIFPSGINDPILVNEISRLIARLPKRKRVAFTKIPMLRHVSAETFGAVQKGTPFFFQIVRFLHAANKGQRDFSDARNWRPFFKFAEHVLKNEHSGFIILHEISHMTRMLGFFGRGPSNFQAFKEYLSSKEILTEERKAREAEWEYITKRYKLEDLAQLAIDLELPLTKEQALIETATIERYLADLEKRNISLQGEFQGLYHGNPELQHKIDFILEKTLAQEIYTSIEAALKLSKKDYGEALGNGYKYQQEAVNIENKMLAPYTKFTAAIYGSAAVSSLVYFLTQVLN